MVVARGWGGGAGWEGIKSYCLMDMGFQFEKMKKILEMDGSNACITVYLMPLNCRFSSC